IQTNGEPAELKFRAWIWNFPPMGLVSANPAIYVTTTQDNIVIIELPNESGSFQIPFKDLSPEDQDYVKRLRTKLEKEKSDQSSDKPPTL
ncbi:MAG: hypothetical protein LBJ67_17105, partial [Planctomycetaceae bacterium]|nr:hypothetical protein [Planctomycetaceae bacterium]